MAWHQKISFSRENRRETWNLSLLALHASGEFNELDDLKKNSPSAEGEFA
jgi:hypothetical protein